MTLHAWRTELGTRLLANGLPLSYVRRTVREMTDHFEELLDHSTQPNEAQQVLGSPAELAARLTASFRNRTWLGRHAWVAFWLLPLPIATFIAHVIYIATIELVMPMVIWLYGETEDNFVNGDLEPWKIAIVLFMHLGLVTVPIAVTITAYKWFANRLGQPWRRQLPALGLISFYFAVTVIELTWPTAGERGNYEIDIGTFAGFTTQPTLQLLQAALALILGGWMTWRFATRQLGRSPPDKFHAASA